MHLDERENNVNPSLPCWIVDRHKDGTKKSRAHVVVPVSDGRPPITLLMYLIDVITAGQLRVTSSCAPHV